LQKLRIVHVVRSPIGGIFRHIADLSRAQSAAGHSVGLVCDSSTGGVFENEQIAALAPHLSLGVRRVPMARSIGPGDVLAFRRVHGAIRSMQPDVVHAHGAKGGIYGRLSARLQSRKGRAVTAFYAPHGGSMHYAPNSLAGRIYFRVERAMEASTDGLIHVSAYEAATYREKVGVPKGPAHVVRNGLASEEFVMVLPKADAADFLYIGMLRDLKGVDVFIAAMAELSKTHPDARAHIVGAGEAADEERYKRMVMGAGLAERVRFHAPMPAREAFSLARTIVVPSRAESMPYIVLEATAAGMPIIATNVGGIPEILDGEDDRLVPPGDAAALSAAMLRSLEDPAGMRGEADARARSIGERFSLLTMAGEVERLYREALDRRYRRRD
jgi:glycosyltransferase involved in cell wall biosynthesis